MLTDEKIQEFLKFNEENWKNRELYVIIPKELIFSQADIKCAVVMAASKWWTLTHQNFREKFQPLKVNRLLKTF